MPPPSAIRERSRRRKRIWIRVFEGCLEVLRHADLLMTSETESHMEPRLQTAACACYRDICGSKELRLQGQLCISSDFARSIGCSLSFTDFWMMARIIKAEWKHSQAYRTWQLYCKWSNCIPYYTLEATVYWSSGWQKLSVSTVANSLGVHVSGCCMPV